MLLIAAAIIEFIVHIVAHVLRSSWFACRTRGIRRVCYLVSALMGLHLLSALIFGLFLDTDLILSALYSKLALIFSAILLVLSTLLPGAITLAEKYPGDSFDRRTARQGQDKGLLVLLSYIIAIAVVFAGLSIWSSQKKRISLSAQICIELSEHVEPHWKERGSKALNLSEILLHQDLSSKLPCRSTQD